MADYDPREKVQGDLTAERGKMRSHPPMQSNMQHVIIREKCDNIGKDTLFKGNNELGLTAYVRANGEGEFKMSQKSIINPKDYGKKGLFGTKMPTSMDVVWIRNGPINEVVLPEVNITMRDGTICIADLRVAYNINIGENSKDITDFMGQFELQMDSQPRIGGGDIYFLDNMDIMDRFDTYAREKFQQAAIGVDSIRETNDEIRTVIEETLGNEVMVTRQLIAPECVSVSFDKNFSEILKEKIAAEKALQGVEIAEMQLQMNKTKWEYDLKSQIVKMEMRFQDQVREVAAKSRVVENQ